MTNPKEEAINVKPAEINQVKQELRSIRDQVNKLLDSLDSKGSEVTSSTEEGLFTFVFVHCDTDAVMYFSYAY